MMNDTTLFISVDLASGPAILFSCDTYLYSKGREIHGKLMYSAAAVYGADSIREVHADDKLYKTAYRNSSDKNAYPVPDDELQTVGMSLGLKIGSGIDQHLCSLPNGLSGEMLFAPKFLTTFDTIEARFLADEIGRKYDVAPDELLITGGLQLFPRPIQEAHDIDIVVPIDNDAQLRAWQTDRSSGKTDSVSEYGFRWPLRWRSSRSHLVCPFFIYRELPPCVTAFNATGEIMDSTVIVVEERYSIFNAPTLIVRGACDLLVCRSTLLRGTFQVGDRLHLKCPVYLASDGTYAGAKVGVVTNPFAEILNISNILNAYQT